MSTGGGETSPRRLGRAIGVAIVAAACLAAIVANQSAVHWRENIADSHLFGYTGWQVSHGARPYLDVWDNKPPGIWWVNAAAFRLTDRGVWPDLLVGGAGLAITIAALLWAAARMHGSASLWIATPVVCGLATHLSFESGANRLETWLMACESGAIACLASRVRGGVRWWLLAGGVLAGAAPWFKQNGLGALAACGVYLAVRLARSRDRRALGDVGAWLGGVAVAWAASIGELARHGALVEAWFAIARFNRLYFENGSAAWVNFQSAADAYLPLLRPVWVNLTIVGIGGVAAFFRRRTSGACASALRPAMWVWLLALAYSTSIAVSPMPYHLMPLLAPLSLLTVDAVMICVGPGRLDERLAGRAWRIAVAVVVVWLTLDSGRTSLLEARRGWSQKPYWASLERRSPAPYEHQGARIRELTCDDDQLYVWGWSPGTYRFAMRRCPCRFATLEKVGQLGAAAEFIAAEAREVVERCGPRAIAISVNDWRAIQTEDTRFARWMVASYADQGDVDGMHILTRRDRAAGD